MKIQQQSIIALILILSLILSNLIGVGQVTSAQDAPQANKQPLNSVIQQNYGQLPLSFVPNMGQTDAKAQFQVNSLGGTLYFTAGEVVLALPQPSKEVPVRFAEQRKDVDTLMGERFEPSTSEPPLVVKMQLISASAEAQIIGTDPLPGIVNYFIGNDPSQWHANIPTYAGIAYRNVYAGIDLQYDGHEGRLKGTYTVAAGVDPSVIRWRYEGNAGLSVDEKTGDLLIALANGSVLREVAPTAWQEKAGKREAVETRYVVDGKGVRFEVGVYDARMPLVIDPTWQYSTFLGGSGVDRGSDIAVDDLGSVYVTGSTSSPNFPSINAFQPIRATGVDAYIIKLAPSGTSIVYSTYLGGNSDDHGTAIAIDSLGNAYVTGSTPSTDFPTQNPFQAHHGSALWNAFVTKLSAAGNSLIYSTYLAGSDDDNGNDIAVDSSGAAYAVGIVTSVDFPTYNALQGSYGGGVRDGYVTKFSPTGDTVVYSTYLGGNGDDEALGIAVDSDNNAYVTGITNSSNFPTHTPFQASLLGNSDIFVTKLLANGTQLAYSTYLGGNATENGRAIAVDGNHNVYITGSTGSANFPLANAIQTTHYGGDFDSDGFVTKLAADGASLVYSTYLGGSQSDLGLGIAVDGVGNTYVTGETSSENFPSFYGFQTAIAGSFGMPDVFVSKLIPSGTSFVYSGYFGGSGNDEGHGIAVDTDGNAYITGITPSIDFPIRNALQPIYGGWEYDGFITKIGTVNVDTIGIFRQSASTFYLRNENSTGVADSSITFGDTTDFPIAGDWNGDGIDTVGVYRQSTGQFFLTESGANPAVLSYSFVLGSPGDQPIVGDWDGNGTDGVGVFRPSNGLIYLKNSLTTGFADFTMVLGIPGDVGIAGDWNGDGKDSPGVYRPSNQQFYLTNSICNCSVFADAQLGLGIAGDTPFVGDWDGDGASGVGVYRQSNGLTYIKNALTTGFADASFVFGSASDYPLAGYWVRVGSPAAEIAPTFQPAK
ncbi:MAG: SBBP repeat-containing protein [Anaerolineae bacterium]|nr:SBBP repeat-containing protein [Anaerolineae bacterium]